MFGRSVISLISCVFCDLRARLAFFWASYLNLPTSRNLATGGSALGDTSTRSSPSSLACSIASRVYITPRFSPSWSITRTLGDTMNSLKRGPFIGGAWRVMGGRIGEAPESVVRGDIGIFATKRKVIFTPLSLWERGKLQSSAG